MANELWKTTFRSSKENTDGSPELVDQEMVVVPPEERFSGVLIVRHATKGTRATRTLRW